MNKLKNKVFFTILTILTTFLLSFVIIYNIDNYIKQKKSIENSFNVAKVNDESPDLKPNDIKENDENKKPNIDENIKFVDFTIYTILLDNNDNIKDIINHSNNNITTAKINELATTILNNNIKQECIGSLYFNNYAYVYKKGNSLTIIDLTNIKKSLILSLIISLLLFTLLEIVIIIVSKKITSWIIKPVNESFTKQKQFIADASHELKTPLAVIMASADALKETPNEKKWLKNIQMESERMNLLITDLLELSKSERKDNTNYKVGNLSKTIELSLLTFEGLAYEKHIKIDYQIEENIKFLMDENSIKQLIEILLDNAIKHSKEYETINISLKNINNNIELLVKNAGDDIPKGEEEKIFERFYRVDKARNRKENRYGLGLAIAKNIVTNHNGFITASSCNGITTFKVLFKK